MKIHSKFKDYYDSVQMYGQDETVHYIRNVEKIDHTQIKSKVFKDGYSTLNTVYHLPEDRKRYSVELMKFVVIFCGKVYRGLQLVKYDPRNHSTYESLGKFFYSAESACDFYEKNHKPINIFYTMRKNNVPAHITEWLSKQGTNELEEYAIENKIPVAYFNVFEGSKNLCLNDIEFFRMVNPYQAYQDLDMYMSGVLNRNANMMVEISDKDRIVQHGFDKWSFRKLPQKM